MSECQVCGHREDDARYLKPGLFGLLVHRCPPQSAPRENPGREVPVGQKIEDGFDLLQAAYEAGEEDR